MAGKGKARVFVTGSADGLGKATAETLLGEGHQVVVHVRSRERLSAVQQLLSGGASVVVGDLADVQQTREVADQVNGLGRMDAVIHNAGVYSGSAVMPVNIIAPYLLTALIERPKRLIYLSSGMHSAGNPQALGETDWSGRGAPGSYSDSKLFVTALAAAVAELWPDVVSHSVDPGWVPTKMGGKNAPDDLRLGHLTQEWLATSNEHEVLKSGGYWHHQRRRQPHPAVMDQGFQRQLIEKLANVTGLALPSG